MKTQELEAAFRATTYRVETIEGRFDLRIGVAHAGFNDFLRRQGVSCWGVLTAYNPGGIQGDELNLKCQAQLQARLSALGYIHFPAINLADGDAWPAEPGFLLLQVNEKEMSKLTSEFFQEACVCGDVGTAPRLVWI